MSKILYRYKSLLISLQEILFHVALEALGNTTLIRHEDKKIRNGQNQGNHGSVFTNQSLDLS